MCLKNHVSKPLEETETSMTYKDVKIFLKEKLPR